MKKTKIICTLGPSSMDENIIKKMVNNGMNSARINLSHGDFEQYEKIIENVRNVSDIPILLDTQGPEVRTVNEDIVFEEDDVIEFSLSVDIYDKLSKGVEVLFNDGMNNGEIIDVKKDSVRVKMMNNGELRKNKSIIFRNIDIELPVLTEKDEKGIKFAVKNNIEFIGVSYTSSADDLRLVKKKLKNTGIRVIAKIENKEGVDNFNEILEEAHGVMIARGDLGVEMPSEKVPMIQKKIIKKCNIIGEPVIVATQMMESMIKSKNPSRAETSDVANAILDGADCLMLSGETSIGDYPVIVVNKMNKICLNTESLAEMPHYELEKIDVENIITDYAFGVADELDAQIICLTRSGHTARMLSRFKPKKNIIAITPEKIVEKQLMINYGVMPQYYEGMEEYDTDELFKTTRMCVKNNLIKKDETIVFVAGFFIKKTTNTITVFKAKDLLK